MIVDVEKVERLGSESVEESCELLYMRDELQGSLRREMGSSVDYSLYLLKDVWSGSVASPCFIK